MTNVIENTLWTEKYRPKAISDFIGDQEMCIKIETFIKNNEIPHLLFVGKPGCGKTTLSKIIVNSIDCDYMFINASDENNIETVRTKIKSFASTAGFKKYKVIVLDEFDYFTLNAQAALRNLMETFSDTTRFILTANYIEKIKDAIISRTQQFFVHPPTHVEVAVHISTILTNEKVEYKLETIRDLVSGFYPDIRKIINEAQLHSLDGTLKITEKFIMDSEISEKILKTLQDSSQTVRQKFVEIRQSIANSKIRDFTSLYSFLYQYIDAYTKNDNIPIVIAALAEGQYRDALVVDKEICFMSTILQILNA